MLITEVHRIHCENGKGTEYALTMVDFNSERRHYLSEIPRLQKERKTAAAKLAALNIIVQFLRYFHKDKLFSKDKTK